MRIGKRRKKNDSFLIREKEGEEIEEKKIHFIGQA